MPPNDKLSRIFSRCSPYPSRRLTGTASWLLIVQMGVRVTLTRKRSGLLMRTHT